MINYQDIYSYIKAEENNYSLPIPLHDDWEFSMKDFIKQCFFYKNGRFLTGNDDSKPFKNIVLYLRNLQDWSEDFNVKNINIYADDKDKQHLSFLIKKYHDDVFTKENDLDTFIDEGKEAKNDYGGVLVKNLNKVRPEVVPFQTIAFCDQTDILSGPIGIKHFYSPDQLKAMEEYGWGDEKNGATITIDDLILLSTNTKQQTPTSQQTKTPGKYIEIYEVHGTFPDTYLKNGKEDKYTAQLHIVGFYKDEKGTDNGVTLFAGKEKELPFKFFSRDKIYGRALGRSAIEELFEDQVWTNYSQKRKMDMLDSASKTIMKTTDSALAAKHPNGLKDLDNLEIIEVEEGRDLNQVDTTPRNINLFTNTMTELEEHAKLVSGATDALLGVNPTSGTPFRLENLMANQGRGLHEARREKYARFIQTIYRDWIIPYISKELVRGVEFISTLNTDELEFVIDRVSGNQAARKRDEQVLSGEIPGDFQTIKQQFKDEWKQRGNKLSLEILEDELKDVDLKVDVDVANANKDLSSAVDKLSNVFRVIIANPQGFIQAMQIPQVAKTFGKIIEYSGLSSPDFDVLPMSKMQEALPPEEKIATV